MHRFCLILIAIFFTSPAFSQLRLPAILSSGMVLQQNDSVMLWGWSGAAQKVFVTTSWNSRTDSTVTSNESKWRLKVKTPVAGGPYTITIKGGNTIRLDDVLIGEVWVCSGQSNMQWSYNNGEKDVAEELPVVFNKNIRFFNIPTTGADYPQDDLKAIWQVCDSGTIKNFSSVGYFFGKKLNREMNIPIGLINSSWGGTPAEVWVPEKKFENNTTLQESAAKVQCYAWWPCRPGRTFNAMIAPLTNYNIAGSIWYQGEGNVAAHTWYRELFTAMIDSWREAWKKDFPFYYVQIAPFRYGNTNSGAMLQEAQTKAMSHLNTGMVVVSDLVDSVTNIHPAHKRQVGYRLANWALAETYKRAEVVYKNPSFTSASVNKGKIYLGYKDAPNGFILKNKKPEGFFISAGNEEWLPAEVKIEKDAVVVWNKSVKNPVYIRYGFGDTVIGNIFSKEGLPVIPYRNDTFSK